MIELNSHEEAVEWLLSLNKENPDNSFSSFKAVVENDIKDRGRDVIRKALRDPRVLPKWYQQLVSMNKTCEGTLAARRSDLRQNKARLLRRSDGKNEWLKAKEEYERSRAATLRFYTGLQQKMYEARTLMNQVFPREALLEEERNKYFVRYMKLREAIETYQKHECSPECDHGCPVEEALYRSLEDDAA